jgi:hypothetical protein
MGDILVVLGGEGRQMVERGWIAGYVGYMYL